MTIDPLIRSAAPAFPLMIREGVEAAVPASFNFLQGLRRVEEHPELASPCDGMFAIMGFMGDFSWTYTLILPRSCAAEVVEAFTGFPIPYTHPDMGDVVGELANVLAGDVIAAMAARRLVARMGLPTVARGTDVEFLVAEGTPCSTLGFRSDVGVFGLRLILAKPTRSWHRRVGIPFGG